MYQNAIMLHSILSFQVLNPLPDFWTICVQNPTVELTPLVDAVPLILWVVGCLSGMISGIIPTIDLAPILCPPVTYQRVSVSRGYLLFILFPPNGKEPLLGLSLIHISEPTRLGMISYAVFCLKKKNNKKFNNDERPC